MWQLQRTWYLSDHIVKSIKNRNDEVHHLSKMIDSKKTGGNLDKNTVVMFSTARSLNAMVLWWERDEAILRWYDGENAKLWRRKSKRNCNNTILLSRFRNCKSFCHYTIAFSLSYQGRPLNYFKCTPVGLGVRGQQSPSQGSRGAEATGKSRKLVL